VRRSPRQAQARGRARVCTSNVLQFRRLLGRATRFSAPLLVLQVRSFFWPKHGLGQKERTTEGAENTEGDFLLLRQQVPNVMRPASLDYARQLGRDRLEGCP